MDYERERRRRKRYREAMRNRVIAAVLLAAVITGAVFLIRGCKKSDAADKDMEQVQDPADNSGGEGIVVDDALLTLVNPWNKLPEDWTVDLVTLSDGHKVDSRCYEALQEMMDACRAAGNSPLICAAYRTEETQQGLYDNKVQRLRDSGMSEEEAKAEAAKTVALPGTSEHQLGLALDIVDVNMQELTEAQEDTAVEITKEYGVVAVCAGAGLADVFRDLGVDQIVEGGQTMNPSTQDILRAVEQTPAQTVFVLPNNKNIILAAQQAAELSDRQVIVIASKTVPQGITAMLNFDASLPAEDNTAAMSDCLDTVTTMQITYAARDSDFDGHQIVEGDYLALCNGALMGTSRDLHALLRMMAEKVGADGKEFVNIFYGADTTQEEAEQTAALFTELAPQAEVNLLSGGQPIYYYLISAE